MRDPRVQNLARILVHYSTAVKEGDTVLIGGTTPAEPLLAAIYEETLKPVEELTADIVRMLSPSFAETGTLFDFPTRKSKSLMRA